MYAFAAVISATQTFMTAALGVIDPTTLIGGAVAVAIGGSLIFSLVRRFVRVARRSR